MKRFVTKKFVTKKYVCMIGILGIVIMFCGCGDNTVKDINDNVIQENDKEGNMAQDSSSTEENNNQESMSQESNSTKDVEKETQNSTALSDKELPTSYIVENQEYVYSPYCDIGQLGEDGYYFDSVYPEGEARVAYETTADITHDGIDDFIQLVIYPDNPKSSVEMILMNDLCVAYVKVFKGQSDGTYESHARFISREFCASHAGNGTICLTHKDGQDYLLLSLIYEMQGTATYDYAVIYVDDIEGITIVDEAGVEFAVDKEQHKDWNDLQHREDVIPDFQEKIDPWILDANIIVSLNVDSPLFLSTSKIESNAVDFYDTVWERNW